MKASVVGVQHVEEAKLVYRKLQVEVDDFERERFEDVGFLTSMMLVVLGNYAQTGSSSLLSIPPFLILSYQNFFSQIDGNRTFFKSPFQSCSHLAHRAGHFGGPLSYTPANVALHLAGPKNGGISYDIRNPKVPSFIWRRYIFGLMIAGRFNARSIFLAPACR